MNDADREILDHFTAIRANTINMVQRVPDELLARTPDGEQHPLNWLFGHIADGVDWWMHNVMRDGRGPAPGYQRDKDSLVQALGASRDRLVSFFAGEGGRRMGETFSFTETDGSRTDWAGRDRVLYLTAHEIHHRGRIELALRQWDFTNLPFFP